MSILNSCLTIYHYDKKRIESNISLEDFMLISVGGFYINKNISIIISSMRKLRSKNAYYILCGDDHKESDLK